MRTLRTPNKNRYLVFVVVAGAHALVIGVLLSKSRWILSSPTVIPIRAFILTRPARPRLPIARPRLNENPVAPITEPITVAPPAFAVTGPSGRAIDWEAEARRSVAKILAPRKRISFGFPPGGKSAITLGVPSLSSPHYAGESYRTAGGELIEWTSDHCYVVSAPPSPFLPQILQKATPTRSSCN
ncbi:MAG: hypothetical protein ACREUL_06215 [Steroidobacteraceae bacterium]